MKRFLLVFVFTAVFVVGGTYLYLQSKVPKTLDEQAYYFAKLGGDYLVRHQFEDGSFDYTYNPETNESVSGYNMLRHAGTSYALFELHDATHASNYRETGERAISYLQSTLAACPDPHGSFICMYDGEKVKLGGNALAVLALVEHARVTGQETYIHDAVALAQWMLAVQSSDGEFTIHVQYRDGALDDHVSEYYPGEAIYALARLYQATNDKVYLEAAQRAGEWLILVRDAGTTEDTILHDHWLLYGLRELYALEPSSTYIAHAKKMVDGIVAQQHTTGKPEWRGGYYTPPRSTPTATRSEGLAAAYDMFRIAGEDEYAQKAYEALELGIRFQLTTAIDGPTARTYPKPVQALGGFRKSLENPEVRIDYVQHNISALLAYNRMANQ